MCERAVEENPYTLEFVPDHLKTKIMRERAVEEKPCTLEFVLDHLKTKEMCEKAVEEKPYILEFVPDHLKTKEMCEKAVEDDLGSWNLFLITLRRRKCVKELLKKSHGHCYMYPIGL